MKKRVKRVLIGASVTVTALVASVAALVLLVLGGLWLSLWIMEAPNPEYYNPQEAHRMYMNAGNVIVTCEPLEIERNHYDAEQLCGTMGIDSWQLTFFAWNEEPQYETEIFVRMYYWDYIRIYENDTAQMYWSDIPLWYSLPEGTYQKVYEQIQELDALPGTGHPG